MDGEEVPFDSIEKQGDWNHADGVWMVVNPDSPATLSYTAENVKELQVDFQMHDGSGVAEVWSNDKRISRTDLYTTRDILQRMQSGFRGMRENFQMQKSI